jgi:small GTP-binding protein
MENELQQRVDRLEQALADLRQATATRDVPVAAPPSVPVVDVAPVVDDGAPAVRRAKVVVCGRSGVGKTSWIRQLCDGRWDPDGSTVTVGMDFRNRNFWIDGQKFAVQLWDTAGMERAGTATVPKAYWRGVHGVLLFVDITAVGGLEDLRAHWAVLERNLDLARTNVLVVGTKSDQSMDRRWSAVEAEKVAMEYGCDYEETTARNHSMVTRAFSRLLGDMYRNGNWDSLQFTDTPTLTVGGIRLNDVQRLMADNGTSRRKCQC